jgi:hypothetical protein
MRKITLLFAAAAICSGVTVTAASAMPIAPVPTDPAAKIEKVRWVCGPYGRCCGARITTVVTMATRTTRDATTGTVDIGSDGRGGANNSAPFAFF